MTRIEREELDAGTPVELFTLTASDGTRMRVTSAGAALVSLEIPDGRDGDLAPLVLGYATPGGWLENPGNLGAVIGPFANRIRDGRFELEGRVVELERSGRHHLHGESAAFASKLWTTDILRTEEGPALRLSHRMPDGEAGFPGDIRVQTVYRLHPGRVEVDWVAESDRPTHLSLTHHPYWNLAGGGDVLAHRLRIPASRVLEIDDDRVPTGRLLEVDDTAFDFRGGVRLGDRLPDRTGRLAGRDGFDHCFAVDGWDGTLREVARLEAPGGRALVLRSTLPGVQLFTAGGLSGLRNSGPGSEEWVDYGGVCIEPQFFPDTPNHPGFPSTRLDPGERWNHRIVMELSAPYQNRM